MTLEFQADTQADGTWRKSQAKGGWRGLLANQVAIARPDHWFKNVFMLPGAALAFAVNPALATPSSVASLIVGIIAVCLIASANYTINEWLDAEFDRHHPVKRHRPSAAGAVSAPLVYIQWAVLATAGLLLGLTIGLQFTIFAAILLIMGVAYNVKPLRTKDRVYLDVLSESVNNPLRFLLGWSAVLGSVLPPSSILLAFWMGGAYLMAVKRYSEYRFIDDPERAGRYRRSFIYYDEQTLLLSAFFYALTTTLFLGVFLIKYRIEFLIAFPFVAALFVWYFRIGMQPGSVTQSPEKLYKERRFIRYVGLLTLLLTALFFVDIPWLNALVEVQSFR
ncbi:UbiA prenyltransferase family protein [Hoeflea sp.]|uniref:UbiA prenyltransferase family protein n=1 Tax=Hoeflea sp. TaxID=1940281 RepID=UPI003B0273BC